MPASPAYLEQNPFAIEHRVLSGNSFHYDKLYKELEFSNKLAFIKKLSPNSYIINDFIINFPKEINITKQENLFSTLLPSYYSKNMRLLETSFKKEISKYSHNFTLPNKKVQTIFTEAATIISELPFDKGIVEITASDSIKFTLVFPGNRLLLISKPFEPIDDLREDEIIFSYFVNHELIMSNASEISKFVEGFKEFLSL